ncbi:helix-turn-helix domain-containing protein [Thermochromatium tepidum]|uniref:Helix-turn-helix domain-containing protein n=1 Tax=Thermochromatium tepidum ATCC 43061 TaxID=316276 RepID=A0A6I6E295_THETI|nr:helix-turn-helix transcriptional regulator [Thermochromatium tepidum]QGU34024.1 helix-turn-helix domain-containing protein [Thermochromatium tepidum ATCC 43061]
MDLTKRIGQRLRLARQQQKLSLADLSARTQSLSKSRISNYEQGIRRMGLEEAHELSVALGTVTPTYLLCLDDRGPLSEQELELVDHFRRTDERGRETLLQLARLQPNHDPAEDVPSESRSEDT